MYDLLARLTLCLYTNLNGVFDMPVSLAKYLYYVRRGYNKKQMGCVEYLGT
jgi:hypothetical protein